MLHTLDFDHEISLQNGFLPDTIPLRQLPEYYLPWEDIVSDLPTHIRDGSIRENVNKLPILSVENLREEEEWRRAYVVLAFLMHAYIWGGKTPKDVLPPAIVRPILEVSSHLEIPPCATYAAVCLWNFTAASSSEEVDMTDPDNISTAISFTGTKDEEWFFVISVSLEAKGGQVTRLMHNAIDAANANNSSLFIALLNEFTDVLRDLGRTLERMSEKCSPHVFFHQLRPFLAGSKNMAAAGLPHGVFYDKGNGEGEWRQYSGGSNGQSSLIQAFDAFLGIEHSATGGLKPNKTSASCSYLKDMRNYMPGPHRRFLERLGRQCNIRAYAMNHKTDSPVRDAYNAAVMALSSFRDIHLRLVSRYIILAARKQTDATEQPGQVNLATATSRGSKESFNGTGGTDLIPFLKETRDTTKAAAQYGD